MIESKCEYDTIKMIDNNKDNNKAYNYTYIHSING